MNKINKFSIVNIKMAGFKNFKEPYTMDFDRYTCISGGNGQGKSTIADAIAYAFCGTPFWGEKSCDRLLNSESREMYAEVRFVDENGEIHTLSRRRNDGGTSIVFDTVNIRQTDIAERLAEKDIFLSLLNPLYFIEKIAEDGREILQKLVPEAEPKDVLAQMSESTRTLLENESLLDPEFFAKKKREELKEIRETTVYLEGQRDLLQKQYDETAAKLDDIVSKGNDIVNRKQILEEKQFDGIDVEKLKKRQNEIASALSDDKRKHLLERRAEVQHRQYVSKFTEEIAKINAEIAAFSAQCRKIVARAKSIKIGDTCPTCHTVVTEENCKAIAMGLKTEYDDIRAKGQNAVSARDELAALDKKSAEKFEEFKTADLAQIEADLAAFGSADVSEIAMLEDKMKYGNLSSEEYAELENLNKQAQAFANEVQVLYEANDIPEKIKAINKQLEECAAKKEELSRLITAVSEYAAKKAEITLQSLQMNRASIKLFDVVKTTGEVKNTFRFTYDGKDYRLLSTSEKIKAGLEVSALLERLTGLVYPKYIDNAECITTKLSPVNGQVILAYARNVALTATYPLRQRAQAQEKVAA